MDTTTNVLSPTRTAAPETVDDLRTAVLSGSLGGPPAEMIATSVFWARHGTRLAGADTTYLNQYLLVRVGKSFGACAFESGELGPEICPDASGESVEVLLRSPHTALRIAALDACLAEHRPHRDDPAARPFTLPPGTPESRARERDAVIAGLMDIRPGARVALIGVVNPLIAAITERGGECLPCDLNLRVTQWGQPVAEDMREVLDQAEMIIATGMTLANGTFDEIRAHALAREVPLIVYAQTGSAVVREFLGAGVSALSAEPFPFSQFSAEPTTMYRYHAPDEPASVTDR